MRWSDFVKVVEGVDRFMKDKGETDSELSSISEINGVWEFNFDEDWIEFLGYTSGKIAADYKETHSTSFPVNDLSREEYDR